MGGGPLQSLPFQVWQSWVLGKWIYIVFYLSRDFMWPHDRKSRNFDGRGTTP